MTFTFRIYENKNYDVKNRIMIGYYVYIQLSKTT